MIDNFDRCKKMESEQTGQSNAGSRTQKTSFHSQKPRHSSHLVAFALIFVLNLFLMIQSSKATTQPICVGKN
jgi:predicted membrane channel-forming protein YqfA (hemolysin III family)